MKGLIGDALVGGEGASLDDRDLEGEAGGGSNSLRTRPPSIFFPISHFPIGAPPVSNMSPKVGTGFGPSSNRIAESNAAGLRCIYRCVVDKF